MKLVIGECYRKPLMISQHSFRWWLSAELSTRTNLPFLVWYRSVNTAIRPVCSKVHPVSYMGNIIQFRELAFEYNEFPDNRRAACVRRITDHHADVSGHLTGCWGRCPSLPCVPASRSQSVLSAGRLHIKMGTTAPAKKSKSQKQMFITAHSEEFEGITASTVSQSYAYCTVCRTDFSVAHSWRYDIKYHCERDKHLRESVRQRDPVRLWF